MKRNYGNKIILSGLCLLLLSACSGGTGGSFEAPRVDANQDSGLDLGGKLPTAPAPDGALPPQPSEAPQEEGVDAKFPAPLTGSPAGEAALCTSACREQGKQCVVSGLEEDSVADSVVVSTCADKAVACADQCQGGKATCADLAEMQRVVFNQFCQIQAAGDSNKLIACAIGYKVKVDAFKASCVQAQAMEHFIESQEKPLPNL
ncbi:hypothetical protein FBR05_05350 [Deltaproteobacteria bacterium PRO3]|nr:hypothetical protein [Deltaproteobacteria bacterium PRO3]